MHGPVPNLQADLRLDVVLPLGIAVVHGAAHHALDDPVLAELVHALDQSLDGGAVPDDGGLVGAVDDLIELVGDDNGSQALLLKLNQQIQQHLGVLVVQGRRRLVQDEQLDVLGEGLGDLHQLLLAGADVLDQGLGGLIQAHLLHMFFGLTVGSVPIYEAQLIFEFIAQEHILADGQQRNQGQLLVDNDDALGLAVSQRLKLAQLAVVIDLTGIGAHGIDAGQDVHQGGFAGAVFADQSVDFAPLHFQIYVVQRLDAGKLLGDGFHLQNDVCQNGFPPLPCLQCEGNSRLRKKMGGADAPLILDF